MRVDNPREIGADRIVNAVAAAELYGAPSLVVDFGTATSFDAVDADGAFVGGAIAPGVRVSTDALADHAARLPKVEIVRPDAGDRPHDGLGPAVGDRARLRRPGRHDRPSAVATSSAPASPRWPPVDWPRRCSTTCETIDHHDPWLTLKGLRLIWERNT